MHNTSHRCLPLPEQGKEEAGNKHPSSPQEESYTGGGPLPQASDTRQKPTDLFTNHPNPQFKPVCKPGSPCHESAPRGSRNGTQGLKNAKERSIIPPHYVNILLISVRNTMIKSCLARISKIF